MSAEHDTPISIRACRMSGAHQFYQELGYTNIKTQHSFGKSLDESGSALLSKFVPRVGD